MVKSQQGSKEINFECKGYALVLQPIIGPVHFIGGSRGVMGARALQGTHFFHFRIHFCLIAPTLEVHTLPNGYTPPTGNPGSATTLLVY